MEKIILNLETNRSGTAAVNFKKEFKDVEIKVGDGATIAYFSDRTPCTIIEIEDQGRWIKVQEDNYVRIDKNGMSDCQDYEYSRNPNGRIHTFKRTRKNKNVYTDNGVYTWGNYGSKLYFGYRERYYDYTF